MGNSHPLEVVGRGSETQLQVGEENFKLDNLAGRPKWFIVIAPTITNGTHQSLLLIITLISTTYYVLVIIFNLKEILIHTAVIKKCNYFHMETVCLVEMVYWTCRAR